MATVLRTLLRARAPRPADFGSPVHDTAVVAHLGRWLGAAVAVCFVTGLISHHAQTPDGRFLGPSPWWGYRVSQGLHVSAGVAAVPLFLGKVLAAYPRLFRRPLLPRPGPAGLPLALERGSIAVLLGATAVELSTGLLNIDQWYVFGFVFVPVHHALAWVMAGALLVHLAVKLPVIRAHLTRRGRAEAVAAGEPAEAALRAGPRAVERRGFVLGVLGVSGVLGLLTVGQSVGPLSRLAVLAPRQPRQAAVQGVPVNKTAALAGVRDQLADGAPGWRLTLLGPTGGRRELTLAELRALPAVTVRLPIACVEGWSTTASWTGVRVADLLALVGSTAGHAARVTSLEQGSAYGTSTLPPAFVDHPDTLLATHLDGAVLDLDHGFPARIIAPNRPGVLQTKWVSRLEGRLP